MLDEMPLDVLVCDSVCLPNTLHRDEAVGFWNRYKQLILLH